MTYRFQRSVTPPGSESSNSPGASDALLPATDRGSSTKAAVCACEGTTFTRCCHRVKVVRGMLRRGKDVDH